MNEFLAVLGAINAVLLSVPVLVALLVAGVAFTIFSGFSQYRSLTHGFGLVSGRHDLAEDGKGVLSHFQALAAALSATVGLGNIGGVAIAVALGGPGAVFWMWMVGVVGMAIKTVEVTLAMIYRDTSDPNNPHGGTMYVCRDGLRALSPRLAGIGAMVGAFFAVALIVFGLTGGNMFQAWNAAELARSYFGVPSWISGIVLAVLVGLVIIGGIRRIGHAAAALVPFMCLIYIVCGLGVLFANVGELPRLLNLIVTSAFSPAEASGAFTGAAVGTAFLFGMRRALFSSEAGMGSAPIAHAAVRTRKPASEGVVAGLEPFIDTLVVCTITAMVILSSGIWDRDAATTLDAAPTFERTASGTWAPDAAALPDIDGIEAGDSVFIVARDASGELQRVYAEVGEGGTLNWQDTTGDRAPQARDGAIYLDLPAAALTAAAFDSAAPGLGRWMVTIAVWLFALSTMITWSYYAEQGVVYLSRGSTRVVTGFRMLWCALIVVATAGIVRTDAQLDTLSTVAIGFMLIINLPVMILLAHKALATQRQYFRELRSEG
ncbi:sodium:alanine symporter family protein [Algiphilus sp.]|uniref:alanine/glycine:cation symporter family protein n=1 Tax=Algiphilus sp. TaxID=1872431 RepID=UPI0025BEF81E|nr:amino acid carrier protein [Algiphilus sp.]MCK5770587.1 sodium:alanine symporter family protein [Algiphilus sp.]